MIKDERFLNEMPCTGLDIRERLRLHKSTVTKRLALLHTERRCHISGWSRCSNGIETPIYTAGDGEDVERPEIPLVRQQEEVRSISARMPKHPATWLDALIYLNGWPA